MVPEDFIQPGGLHGDENRNSSGLTLRASRRRGKDVGFVVVDAEFLQLGIGLVAVVVGVGVAGVVAGADAGAADVERHFAGGEEVVEDGFAGGGGKLAEDIAGGIGEGAAKAEDLLARRAGVEGDGVGCDFTGRAPSERGGCGVTAIAKGGPDRNGSAGGEGGQTAGNGDCGGRRGS